MYYVQIQTSLATQLFGIITQTNVLIKVMETTLQIGACSQAKFAPRDHIASKANDLTLTELNIQRYTIWNKNVC